MLCQQSGHMVLEAVGSTNVQVALAGRMTMTMMLMIMKMRGVMPHNAIVGQVDHVLTSTFISGGCCWLSRPQASCTLQPYNKGGYCCLAQQSRSPCHIDLLMTNSGRHLVQLLA
jgi:hypothetical protein